MKRRFLWGAVTLIAAAGLVCAAGLQDQAQDLAARQAISWDNWKEARATAEKYDNEGKFVEALQYYLEYARQAEGLNSPELVAWGKNNAAYMITKRHKLDATVDLAPARKLVEEAMTIEAASEDCKKCLELNLEYINLFQKK
jgi:hypothetical protein